MDPASDLNAPGRRWLKLLAVVGLVLLAGQFVVRGPARSLGSGSHDYAFVYAASGAWLSGQDPFSHEACVAQLAGAGHPVPETVTHGSLYPPPTISIFAPLAWLDWEASRGAWLGVNLLSVGAMGWVVFAWLPAGLSWRCRAGLAAAVVLAWAPIHTAFFVGQLSILVGACLAGGLLLVQRGRPWLAGGVIGLACCVKPQLGLGFLVLLALGGYWRAIASGSLVLAAASGIAILRLMQTTPDWVAHLRANIAEASVPGGMVDAGPAAVMRYQMLDLRPILFGMTDHPAVVWSVAWAVAAVAGGLALFRLYRLGLREHWLLAGGGVSLLMLLPVYHRYYDAVILLPLIIWVLRRCLAQERDKLAWLMAGCLLPLVVPGPTVLFTLQKRGTLPEALGDSWLWTYGVLQHQSWCLLLILVALLVWLYRRPRPEGAAAAGPPTSPKEGRA